MGRSIEVYCSSFENVTLPSEKIMNCYLFKITTLIVTENKHSGPFFNSITNWYDVELKSLRRTTNTRCNSFDLNRNFTKIRTRCQFSKCRCERNTYRIIILKRKSQKYNSNTMISSTLTNIKESRSTHYE